MAPDSVRAFVNGRVELDPACWHSNQAIWDAYLDHCRENEYIAVGESVALSRYLNEILEGDPVERRQRTVDGEQRRGWAGIRVEGAPGIDYSSGESERFDGQE